MVPASCGYHGFSPQYAIAEVNNAVEHWQYCYLVVSNLCTLDYRITTFNML